MVGTTDEPMFTVIELEVALLGDAQASDEVSVQVIADPDASVELIKRLLFVPALTPFTFH